MSVLSDSSEKACCNHGGCSHSHVEKTNGSNLKDDGCTDSQLADSEHAIYASANNDLKGTKAYQEADVPGVYNLAMAIIDYRGHRVATQDKTEKADVKAPQEIDIVKVEIGVISEEILLNPNGLTEFKLAGSEEELAADEENVRKAGSYLKDVVLPKFVQDLCALEVSPMDSQTLTEALHAHRINVRYIGKVANMTKHLPHIWDLCAIEIVVRSAKHVLKDLLRDSQDRDIGPAISHFFNYFFGNVHLAKKGEPSVDPEAALTYLGKHCQTAVVTLVSNGCLAKHGNKAWSVKPTELIRYLFVVIDFLVMRFQTMCCLQFYEL